MGFALNFLPPTPPIPTLHFLDAFSKEKEEGEKYFVWQLKCSRKFIFKGCFKGSCPVEGLMLTEWLLGPGCWQHPGIKSGWRTEVCSRMFIGTVKMRLNTKFCWIIADQDILHFTSLLVSHSPLPPPHAKNTKNKETLLFSAEFYWERHKSLETIRRETLQEQLCLFWAVGREHGLLCATPFSCSDWATKLIQYLIN